MFCTPITNGMIDNYLELVNNSASNWLGVNIEATGTTFYKVHYKKIVIKSVLLSGHYINVIIKQG